MKRTFLTAALVAVLAALTVAGRGAVPAQADPSNVLLMSPGVCLSGVVGTYAQAYCASPVALRYSGTTGDQALQSVANVLGKHDIAHVGIAPSDFTGIVTFGGNQIHQQDGNSVSELAVIAFVQTPAPVTFHTTAGHFIVGQQNVDSGATWTCVAADDPDCGNSSGLVPPMAPDHVVVAYLTCTLATCPTRGDQNLTVTQNSIVFPVKFTVVGEPRTVEFFTLEKDVQAGVGNNAAGNPDCPLPTDVAGFTKALGEAEKTIIITRARDIDGTAITGAWFNLSVDDPTQAVVALPTAPTLDLGGFGKGAPDILCALPGAKDGTVTVKATLITSTAGLTVDPGAAFAGGAFGKITFNVHAIPSKLTLTAAPAVIPCDGQATSTVSAALTDDAGNPAISGTAVHFDAQVLGTANPIDATTNDKGIATSTVAPLAGDVRGVPVTVSVKVGGVLQPNMTQSILVQCGGAGASAPAPAAPGAPASGGSAAGSSSVAGAAQPNLPRSGAAEGLRVSGGLWALIAGAATVALFAGAGGIVARRRTR